MKTRQITLFLSLLIMPLMSMAQEEEIASGFGAHKEWNVAYVKELQMDSGFTTNAILIQAYSDEQWEILLDTLGIIGKDLCSEGYSKDVVFWFADSDSSESAAFFGQLPALYLGFGNCAERTIALFFPNNDSELQKIFSHYLVKELLELHRFAQRCRTIRHVSTKTR